MQRRSIGNQENSKLGILDTWINLDVITSILSTPKLDKVGYHIVYDTQGGWAVQNPEGNTIEFESDSGECEGMPYVNLSDPEATVMMVKTARKQFEIYTKKEA